MLCYPIEQGGDIAGHALRGGKSLRIGGGQPIDDEQPRVRLSAVLGVDGAVDRGRKHDPSALLEANKGIGPCRVIWCKACASDGDEASTVAKTRERRSDVPESGVRHSLIHIRHCRERRVHQNDARYDTRVEVIIDLGGVEPRDVNVGEQMIQQRRAAFGQFVQHQGAAGELGKDSEQAGPRGWFQNAVSRRNAGGGAGGQPKRDRRRELLKRLAVLGTPGMGRQTARDFREHWQHRSRRASLGAHGRTELAKE